MITYTEKELCSIFKCGIRKIRDLRKQGVLKGVKVARNYVYSEKEIKNIFEKYEGLDLPKERR